MPGRGRLPAGAETPTGPFRFLFPVLSLSPSFFPLFSISFLSLFPSLFSTKNPFYSLHNGQLFQQRRDCRQVCLSFPNSVSFQSSLASVLTFFFFRSTIRTLAADVVAKACRFSTKEHTSNTKLTGMCRLTLVTPVPPWSVCTSVFLLKRCSLILCSQGMAPVAHVLFTRFMKFNSKNPKWINRDRFVLSNGHA